MRDALRRHLPNPGSGTEPAAMLRIIGLLYLSGALLVAVTLVLPRPESANVGALSAIVVGSIVIGLGMLRFARAFDVWAVHFAIALGSAIICACVYFAGEVTGGYESMFIWAILVSAYFFPGRGAATHLTWLLAAYAVTLALLPGSGGFSLFSRWLIIGFSLAIASALTSWLASGVRREIEAREYLEEELRHLAEHDPLTGLINRRRLEAELARELARARRSGVPVCVAVLDLDGFKAFNDANGHAEGDELLRTLASLWASQLRESDLLGRFGGDEFLALLPDCRREEGFEAVERLRRTGAREVTCSAGLAVSAPDDDVASLIARADRALYEAKRDGRNTLALAG